MSQKMKVEKKFVSKIDNVLAEFDRKFAKAPSQLAEIKKYARIYQLRDHPIYEEPKEDIWGDL